MTVALSLALALAGCSLGSGGLSAEGVSGDSFSVGVTHLDGAPTVRAFATTPHMNGKGPDLSADEFYALILAADNGVSFFARENNPGDTSY